MNIPDAAIRSAVLNAGEKFDSHYIIKMVAHDNQRLYVDDLAATDSDKPFQTLHSVLGRRIKAICEEFGFSGNPSSSPDIFGQNSNCIEWTRI